MENNISRSLGIESPEHQITGERVSTQENGSAEVFRDVRIIRRWVQFFGWLTIISLIVSAIAVLVSF